MTSRYRRLAVVVVASCAMVGCGATLERLPVTAVLSQLC